MSTHTPGPWWTENLYYESHPSNTRTDILAAAKSDKHSGTKVAEASFSPEVSDYHVDNRKEAEANARLIAAAPCLLAALKAIADLEDTESNEWDAVERLIPEMCNLARAAIAKAEGSPS